MIVVAHLAGVSTGATALAAQVYVAARVLYTVIFLSGASFLMIRRVVFNFTFLPLVVIAWKIATKAG